MAWIIERQIYNTESLSSSPAFRLVVTVAGDYPFLFEGDVFMNTASCMDMVVVGSEADPAPGEVLIRKASVDLIFRCRLALDSMLDAINEDLIELEHFQTSKNTVLASSSSSSDESSSSQDSASTSSGT